MRLANVSWLVLDEADRLLDRGFTENLKEVLSELDKQRQLTLPGLPSRRQTILCSATLDGQVHALAKRTLDRPVRVDGRHQNGVAVGATTPMTATTADDEDRETADSDDSNTDSSGDGPSGPGTVEPTRTTAYVQPAQLQQAFAAVPIKLRLVTLVGSLLQLCARRPTKGMVFFCTRDSVDFHHALLSQPAPDATAPLWPTEPSVRAAAEQLHALLGLDKTPEARDGPASDDDDADADGGDAPGTASAAAAAAAAEWGLPAPPVDRVAVRETLRHERRINRQAIRQGALLPVPLFKLHGQLPAAARTLVHRAFCAAREVRGETHRNVSCRATPPPPPALRGVYAGACTHAGPSADAVKWGRHGGVTASRASSSAPTWPRAAWTFRAWTGSSSTIAPPTRRTTCTALAARRVWARAGTPSCSWRRTRYGHARPDPASTASFFGPKYRLAAGAVRGVRRRTASLR